MTPMAVLSRINQFRVDANNRFRGNKYITIHDYRNSADQKKRDPYSVWVDLNFSIYVDRNGKPVLVDGMRDIRIQFSPEYPQKRPTVTCPENIASVHCWGNHTLCTHTSYDPDTHTLIQELENLMCLAANCPESINYNSMCRPMKHYRDWTERLLKSGQLPTVPKKLLLPGALPRTRRRFSFE